MLWSQLPALLLVSRRCRTTKCRNNRFNIGKQGPLQRVAVTSRWSKRIRIESPTERQLLAPGRGPFTQRGHVAIGYARLHKHRRDTTAHHQFDKPIHIGKPSLTFGAGSLHTDDLKPISPTKISKGVVSCNQHTTG